MGWGQSGYHDGKIIPNPNIDAISQEGVHEALFCKIKYILQIILKLSVCITIKVESQPVMVAGGAMWEIPF